LPCNSAQEFSWIPRMTMHKILIVDDELAIRDMLRLALETAG
jgi:CheY-like chemotaxis protein